MPAAPQKDDFEQLLGVVLLTLVGLLDPMVVKDELGLAMRPQGAGLSIEQEGSGHEITHRAALAEFHDYSYATLSKMTKMAYALVIVAKAAGVENIEREFPRELQLPTMVEQEGEEYFPESMARTILADNETFEALCNFARKMNASLPGKHGEPRQNLDISRLPALLEKFRAKLGQCIVRDFDEPMSL